MVLDSFKFGQDRSGTRQAGIGRSVVRFARVATIKKYTRTETMVGGYGECDSIYVRYIPCGGLLLTLRAPCHDHDHGPSQPYPVCEGVV